MWDTLEMIYEVSPSIKQDKMNTRGEEDEDNGCFQSLEILEIVSLTNI